MKRKFVCKRIYMVLAGAALLCALCSCTSNHEKEDFESGNYWSRYGETIKDETGQGETVNAGTGKDEAVKGETGKDEALKGETAKDDPGKDGAVKGETAKEDPGKGEVVKGDSVKDGTEDYGMENPSVKEPDRENQTVEDPLLSIGESYQAILSGEKDFISVDLGNKELNIKDIRNVVTPDDSVTVEANKFTFLDLDGDGENEIVLWLQINNISDYGFEILHAKEGAVYGYTLPYRAFMDLKTDGTFSFSSGAADSGIGKLRFAEDGYTIEEQVYGEDQQETKTDVIWYDSF